MSKAFRMSETSSRTAAGMSSPRHSNQTHQAVMDRLRHRIGGYRKHHATCENKYAQSLSAVHDIEKQEGMTLYQRALDNRNRSIMNVNGKATKQNDGEGKVEPQQQLPNGLDKSTNAILHIREQLLQKKRKHEQNMNSSLNSFAPSNDDNNRGGEYVSKFQRQDGVLLQAPEGSNSVASVDDTHQVDHTSTQIHQSHFDVGDNSYIHDGSMNTPRISTTIGSESYANGSQPGLSSASFARPDFKQEKSVIVSCEEPTPSKNGPGTLTTGLNQVPGQSSKFHSQAGQEYIQQELEFFDHIIQARFNEDGAPVQAVQQQANPSLPAYVDDRNQLPENQLGGHHPKSHQLKEFARKSQLAQAQQVVPYIDSQDHANHQFPSQQYGLGSAGQQSTGLQRPYSTGKYSGRMPMIPSDQQQMLQEQNHPVVSIAGGFPRQYEALQYQRGPSTQSQQQQQQQQSFYGFSQNSLPSPKLSHMPPQVQQLYSPRFQSEPVQSTSQGAVLVQPVASQDLVRYSMPRSQPQYQRQNSMPPLQNQTFLNSNSQYQRQVAGFQGDQSGFSNPAVDLAAAYHYQRRNSFPIYRNNTQPPGNLSHGMQQNLASSQTSLLRGVLQNPSQSGPADRDSFVVNPNMGMPSSSPIQTGPLLTGRPPSANADLNPGVPRSQHSSIMYRSNASQQSTSGFQQGGKFHASNDARKVPPDSSYSVLTPASAPLRDMNERRPSGAGSDVQFNAYSPLNALDKAPSFTSLLEQSAVNQGNLETTYTGSIPNLDLLGEILGQ